MENNFFFYKTKSELRTLLGFFNSHEGHLKNCTPILPDIDVYHGNMMGFFQRTWGMTKLVTDRKILVKVTKIVDKATPGV